jgi:drug/metabolite transporter (DMT)-like permease
MQKPEKIFLAVFLTIISSLAYALMIAMTKIVGQTISSPMIILFRYGVTFLILLPFIAISDPSAMKTTYPQKHLFRSIFGFLGLVTTMIATRHISVPNAVLLSNTYPLFLPLLIFFYEKKQLSKSMTFGILIGFFGIGYILQPSCQMINPYEFLALSSGFFTAMTMTYVRELTQIQTMGQINFQFLCYSLIFALILSVFQFQIPAKEILWKLLLIGLIGTIYQQTFVWALRYAHSVIVAPIFYLSIVFGALIEWIGAGTTPTRETLIGCGLVFIGATITVVVGGQAKHLTRR